MPTTNDRTTAPGEEVRDFVDFLGARFEGGTAGYAAFRLDGFTVVAARGAAGYDLELFVRYALGGAVQAPGKLVAA